MSDHPGSYALDDHTWAPLANLAIDVDAAERRTTRRVGRWIAGAVLLIAAVILSGVWTPRLTPTGAAGGGFDLTSPTPWIEMDVINPGLVPVTVDGPAEVSMSGVRGAASTHGAVPPLGRGVLRVELVSVDCAAVRSASSADATLTVTARTWHGDEPLRFDTLQSSLVGTVAKDACEG